MSDLKDSRIRRLECDLIVAQNQRAVVEEELITTRRTLAELQERVQQLRKLVEDRPALPLIVGARKVGLVKHGHESIRR